MDPGAAGWRSGASARRWRSGHGMSPRVRPAGAAGGQQQRGCPGRAGAVALPQVPVQAAVAVGCSGRCLTSRTWCRARSGRRVGIVVAAVEADRLADAHAGGGQQPDQGLEGRPAPAGPARRLPGQGRDLLIGVEVGERDARAGSACGAAPGAPGRPRSARKRSRGPRTAGARATGRCAGRERRPGERVLVVTTKASPFSRGSGELAEQFLVPFHLESHGAADGQVFLERSQPAHAASPGQGRARARSPS